MKKNIHPKYYDKAKVTCSCGATFETGSTEPEIHVEICSVCHPFYTGTQKFIDTAGRLDRFKARLEKSQKINKKFNEKRNKYNSVKKTEEFKPAEPKNIDGGQKDK